MIAPASQPVELTSPATPEAQAQCPAESALASSNYASLRKLRCKVAEGEIEISGTVPSFYLKQLAIAAVQQLNPGAMVRDLVEVQGKSLTRSGQSRV